MTIPRLVRFIVGLLLAAHLVLLGFFPISSEDTWWHLKQGELYVTTRSLPAQDPFAFTTAGRQWIHYSWVPDILFYLIFRAAGLQALVLLRLLLLLLTALVLYRLLRNCGLHPFACVLLVLLASLALRFRLLIRPEILSFLLLLATMAILLRLRVTRPQFAYALLPVQIIWTNVHGSFVFGMGLPALVLLANLLPIGRAEPGWGHLRLDRVHVRHLAAATALLPLSSLLNPHGVYMLLFPLRQNRVTRLRWLSEWVPVWDLPRIDPIWWEVVIVLSVVVLAFVATGLLLFAWEGRFDSVGWGIIFSMGTYGTFWGRAVPYFTLAILPLLALALVRAARHLPARGSQGLERAGVLACLLVLGVSIWYQAPPTSRFSIGFGLRPDFFPEGAVTFLERHHLDGRIFNSYVFGGYLIWSRWPSNQVLIDGRYDNILFDQALLEAYIEAHRSAAALDRITAMYAIDILVLNTKPGQGIPYLSRDPNWARVYWDPVAEVYVRRGERYADLIAAHEYRLTGPAPDTSYLAAYRRDADTWARALAELRRAVTDNPQNLMAWLGLAQEYRAAGPAALGPRLDALTHAEALMMARAPGLGRLHADRADALLQFGRLDEAKAEAQKALRLQRDLLLARSVLASVAERRRAWAEARDQLQLIMASLAPGDPRVPEIRERLANVERGLQGDGGR